MVWSGGMTTYEDVNVATAAPKELLQTLAKKLRAVVGNGGRPQFI